MPYLIYLKNYPESIKEQIATLLTEQKLEKLLKMRYPINHNIKSDKALYQYTVNIKNTYLKQTSPLRRICFDEQIVDHSLISDAPDDSLQYNSFIINRLSEIRIADFFKQAPEPMLRIMVIHKLAHIIEKAHNSAFYKLCHYMEPNYQQLEFETRLFLTQREYSRYF